MKNTLTTTLAVAVTSKDGEFPDELKVFTGDDASRQAAEHFRTKIADSIEQSWTTEADVAHAAALVRSSETIEELAKRAADAYELVMNEHEGEAWMHNVHIAWAG